MGISNCGIRKRELQLVVRNNARWQCVTAGELSHAGALRSCQLHQLLLTPLISPFESMP